MAPPPQLHRADVGLSPRGGEFLYLRDSEDGRFFLSGFECLGACDMAPMASIDDRYYGPLDRNSTLTAIEQLLLDEEVLPDKALQPLRYAGFSRGDNALSSWVYQLKLRHHRRRVSHTGENIVGKG